MDNCNGHACRVFDCSVAWQCNAVGRIADQTLARSRVLRQGIVDRHSPEILVPSGDRAGGGGMSGDIVERLKDANPEEDWTGSNGLMEQAATEITSLRAELARLRDGMCGWVPTPLERGISRITRG